MRYNFLNEIDGFRSRMDKKTQDTLLKTIEKNQDVDVKDGTFYRDGMWRSGAFQLTGMGRSDTDSDYAMFGGGGGPTVAP